MLKCKKERIDVKHILTHFCKFSAVLATIGGVGFAHADQAPNPRSATVTNVASGRSEGRVVKRGAGTNANVVANTSRSAVRRDASVASRDVAMDKKKTARSATAARVQPGRSATVARSGAINAGRAAMPGVGANAARSAASVISGLARAASRARATAVFSDISKIGGGYSECRDAYATCMDQFCANANDTYRRCFCSSRFTEFRDMEWAMDQAKVLLQKFEDNNLNAVDKTAAEVNAMYTATVGEAAIKNDTSGAQSILNEIGDLLSGKKKATSSNAATSSSSMGIMSLDFSTDIGDVWGEGGADPFDSGSIFSTGGGVDLTTLEGQALYNESNKQCVQLIKENCESNAVLNMATSAYNIMISQDCNAYEKSVNKKREQVMSTVRQAEKILRDARLEEYRAHNSRDVNECIAKVQAALLADTACGPNYKRCLDYSGAYVNQSTGEPIYSQRLFELTNIITLAGAGGDMDVLGQNPKFDQFLDSKKMYAETALDSCRGIADNVWTEFKRMALIEIAQAQDAKIEEVKMSCVNTMKECYDTQSSALKSFDDTTAKTSGAMSAYAAKAMCEDKVIACASLYGDTTGCEFDGNGRLTAGTKKADGSASTRCGLTSLLAFVDTVDNVRVAEGCDTAIETQLKEWCTPTDGSGEAYPWNCRQWGLDELSVNVYKFAANSCADPTKTKPQIASNATAAAARQALTATGAVPLDTLNKIDQAINEIKWQMEYVFIEKCEELDGYWVDAEIVAENKDSNRGLLNAPDLIGFYNAIYGTGSSSTTKGAATWGKCVQNTTRVLCEAYNSNVTSDKEDVGGTTETKLLAKYNADKDECEFSAEWYENQCKLLGNGYYENGVCYVAPEN